MTGANGFSVDQARGIGEQVGIDWGAAPFDVEQFRRGLDVELVRPPRSVDERDRS